MRITKYIKQHVTSKNESIIDIANVFRYDYGDIQSFVVEANKLPDLYLMTNLQKWCSNEVDLYKVDLYECEKDSVECRDWWLCLKHKNNGPFKFENIPPKIQSSLESVFDETCHNFKEDKCSICLMTSSNPKDVEQALKSFLKDLENR